MPILLRALLRLTMAGVFLLGGLLCVALLFPWLSSESRVQIKQCWSAGLLFLLGVERVHDDADLSTLPHGLVVANHISFLDIFVINALMPTSFVAKSDVANWPLIGWLVARTGNLFIERGSRRAAHLTQEKIASALTAGHRLVVFPEGTSTVGGQVLPFHAALLQSAIDSRTPVVCLALSYWTRDGQMTHVPAYAGTDTLWDSLWRIAQSAGIVARIDLAGCLPSMATDRRHLAHLAHQRIARALATRHM